MSLSSSRAYFHKYYEVHMKMYFVYVERKSISKSDISMYALVPT